jgi:hypothetical protein
LVASVLSETPEYTVVNSTDITRIPGRMNWRYSSVEPAMAPPNM